MKFTSEMDLVTGICTVRATGEYRRPLDSDEMKRFAANFCVEHGCHLFLFDYTQAEVFSEPMRTFHAGNPQGEIAKQLRTIKTAFVREVLTEDDHFFETVALNRGFQLRAFDSFEKAIEWLIQGKS